MEPKDHTTIYSDHDLLIRVDTKLEGLTDEVRLMRDGTKDEIKTLKEGKVDKEIFSKLVEVVTTQGKQIDKLTKLVYIGVGIVLLAQLVITISGHSSGN